MNTKGNIREINPGHNVGSWLDALHGAEYTRNPQGHWLITVTQMGRPFDISKPVDGSVVPPKPLQFSGPTRDFRDLYDTELLISDVPKINETIQRLFPGNIAVQVTIKEGRHCRGSKLLIASPKDGINEVATYLFNLSPKYYDFNNEQFSLTFLPGVTLRSSMIRHFLSNRLIARAIEISHELSHMFPDLDPENSYARVEKHGYDWVEILSTTHGIYGMSNPNEIFLSAKDLVEMSEGRLTPKGLTVMTPDSLADIMMSVRHLPDLEVK